MEQLQDTKQLVLAVGTIFATLVEQLESSAVADKAQLIEVLNGLSDARASDEKTKLLSVYLKVFALMLSGASGMQSASQLLH